MLLTHLEVVIRNHVPPEKNQEVIFLFSPSNLDIKSKEHIELCIKNLQMKFYHKAD